MVELVTRAPGYAGELLDVLKNGGNQGERIRVAAIIKVADFPPGGPGAGPVPPLFSVIQEAARKLGSGSAVRFPRTRLVSSLAALDPSSSAKAPVDFLDDELRNYWAALHRGNTQRQDAVSTVVAVLRAFPNPAVMLAELINGLVRRHFGLWFRGTPGLGAECRWLRGQARHLAPGETFATFLLGLTATTPEGASEGARGRRRTQDAEKDLLAAQALLEDLRVAHQPRLWVRHTWNRYRRPVLILDNLPDDALPDLLDRARRETGKRRADPLLVVLVQRPGRRGHAFSSRQVHRSGDLRAVAYPRLRRPHLARAEFATVPLVLLALLTLPVLSAVGARVPWPWGQAGITAGGTTPGPTATGSLTAGTSCPKRDAQDADTQVIAWRDPDPSHAIECVGYSDGYTFTNPDYELGSAQAAQQWRLTHDQQQVFVMDRALGDAGTREAEQGAPVYEIAYVAGLTEGPLDEYDSAEAEEMEGLLAAQRTAAYGSSVSGATPSLRNPQLRVIIANGGSKMQDAAQVARMLIKRFAGDKYFLGVVGMDRSTGEVQRAIEEFSAAKVPVLATTLSADERVVNGQTVQGSIGGGSRYYFQLGAANTAEAALIMRYIQDAVPSYFRQPYQVYPSHGSVTPQKIMIYEPTDTEAGDADLYVSSMVADLRSQGAWYHQRHEVPMPVVTQNVLDKSLCGASTVDIFAGRHDLPLDPASGHDDDFTTFLTQVAKCGHASYTKGAGPLDQGVPFIITDDGVSRFIADPADRRELPQIKMPISYVSKGIRVLSTGRQCLSTGTDSENIPSSLDVFCGQYASIATALQEHGINLLWTGERVGLAYDAAEMFWQSADSDWLSGKAITRQGIPGAFSAPAEPFDLVSGAVNFVKPPYTGTDTSSGMPLAVLRIHISSAQDPPACEFSSLTGYKLAAIPNLNGNAFACLGKSNLPGRQAPTRAICS